MKNHLLLMLALSIFFQATVAAEMAYSADDALPARIETPQGSEPDAAAVAKYQEAVEQENLATRELLTVEEIRHEIENVKSLLTSATKSLEAAGSSSGARRQAVQEIMKRLAAGLKVRKDALGAIDTYRWAVKPEIAALQAFATANEASMEKKAKAADAALKKKAECKTKAEGSIGSAKAELVPIFLLYDIDKRDGFFKADLSQAQTTASAVAAPCSKILQLSKMVTPELSVSIGTPIADIQARIDSHIKKVAAFGSEDESMFSPKLKRVRDLYKNEPTQLGKIEDVFEKSAIQVVKTESLAFLDRMRGAQKKGSPAGGKDLDSTFGEAVVALKTARTDTKKGRQALVKDLAATERELNQVLGDLQPLSQAQVKVTALLVEPTAILSDVETTEKKAIEAVAAKQVQLRKARETADDAFFAAYGTRRAVEAPAAQAAAPQLPVEQPAQAVALAPPPPMDIRVHVYSYVTALRRELPNYGAYTYVLFRQHYKKALPHIKKQYDAILDAIIRNVPSAASFTAPIPERNRNLFCIPAGTSAQKAGIPEYDSDLAWSFLATAGSGALLRSDMVKTLRNSPGPFLLTTRTRLSEGNSQTQVLFVDLSEYPAEGYDSVLAAYMNTLIEHPPVGKVIWQPPIRQRIAYTAITNIRVVSDLLAEFKRWRTAFVSEAEASEGP